MTDDNKKIKLDDAQAEAVTGGAAKPAAGLKYFCNTCFTALTEAQAEQHKKQGHYIIPFNL